MTEDFEVDADTITAMHLFGGSFAQALVVLYQRGDDKNRRKIRQNWPEVFEHYKNLARVLATKRELEERKEQR